MSRQVKALRNFKPTEPGTSEHLHARHALGEAFGTKKAKAAIQAHERNKMDVSVMESVADVLQDRIEEGTENLPTQGVSQVLCARNLIYLGGQKKWRKWLMRRVSSQLTTQMPRNQSMSILCIISSRTKSGQLLITCFTNSKTNPMITRENGSCQTLAVIGYGST